MRNENVEIYKSLLEVVRNEFQHAVEEMEASLNASLAEIENKLQSALGIDHETHTAAEMAIYNGAENAEDIGNEEAPLSIQDRINASLEAQKAQKEREELTSMIQQQLAPLVEPAIEEALVVPAPSSLSNLIADQVAKPEAPTAVENKERSPRTMRKIIEELKSSVADQAEYEAQVNINKTLEEKFMTPHEERPDINIDAPSEKLADDIRRQLLSEQIKKVIAVNTGINALASEGTE